MKMNYTQPYIKIYDIEVQNVMLESNPGDFELDWVSPEE